MKFGDIFPLLLVLLILYYAAMIAMDLYKARLEKEAEKEKNTEEEIDISDEAATFQPTRIRRDDPKKPIVPASAESPRNETEDKNKDKANTAAPSKNEEKRPEAPKDNEPVQEKDKADETPETKTDPFDPESYKIPDEVIAEHRKEHTETADEQVPHSEPSPSSGPQPSNQRKKPLRGPVMTNGIPADDLVSLIEAQSNGIPSDLQNFAYKCESA